MITPEEFEALLPLACAWAEEQERLILANGVALTERLMADARRVGVLHPERVRLMVVEEISLPVDARLRTAAEMTGLISPDDRIDAAPRNFYSRGRMG
jgi:hypothetical protein